MTHPSPIEGAALYGAATYLVARDVLCAGVVHHLLPVAIVGAGLAAYCVFRAGWCLRRQVWG